jgi:hypothetical protein
MLKDTESTEEARSKTELDHFFCGPYHLQNWMMISIHSKKLFGCERVNIAYQLFHGEDTALSHRVLQGGHEANGLGIGSGRRVRWGRVREGWIRVRCLPLLSSVRIQHW